MNIHAIQRRPAARDLAARRPPGPGCLPVRRLARRRGPVVVAGAAARTARSGAAHRTSRARRSRPGPGCSPTAAAPVSDAEVEAFRERHAAWIDDWAAFAGGRRAVNDQVRFDREWGALRAYAAERGVRLIGDVPIYVAPGSADHARAPRAVPRRRRRRRRRPTRSPPRASCGATRSTTGRRCAGAATAGGPSACGAPSSSSTSRGSTTSAASSPTGRCPPARATRRGGRWVRGPGRAVFDAARPRARRAADHRRGPRRHHAAGAPPARRARPAGHGRAAVRLRARRPGRASHDPANHIEHQVLYTGTHDNDTLRGWWETLARASAAALARRRASAGATPWWDLIAHRPALAGAAVHAPGPGRARPRQRGAHEHRRARRAGNWRFRLERGAADRAPRAAPAGADARRPGAA